MQKLGFYNCRKRNKESEKEALLVSAILQEIALKILIETLTQNISMLTFKHLGTLTHTQFCSKNAGLDKKDE